MTIQDKIAALPPKAIGPSLYKTLSAYFAVRTGRAEAERDLALEVLRNAYRELNEIHARDGVPYTCDGWKSSVSQEWFTQVVEDARAVLAACGGESK